MQGRGGRPDNGRGWEGRKQRREAWRIGVGAGGERRDGADRGEGRAPVATTRGKRECGDLGENRRDEERSGEFGG